MSWTGEEVIRNIHSEPNWRCQLGGPGNGVSDRDVHYRFSAASRISLIHPRSDYSEEGKKNVRRVLAIAEERHKIHGAFFGVGSGDWGLQIHEDRFSLNRDLVSKSDA